MEMNTTSGTCEGCTKLNGTARSVQYSIQYMDNFAAIFVRGSSTAPYGNAVTFFYLRVLAGTVKQPITGLLAQSPGWCMRDRQKHNMRHNRMKWIKTSRKYVPYVQCLVPLHFQCILNSHPLYSYVLLTEWHPQFISASLMPPLQCCPRHGGLKDL